MKLTVSVALGLLLFHGLVASAADVSMTGEQFFALSKEDQKATLSAALHFRLDRSRNLRYDVDVELFNHEIDELNYVYDANLRNSANRGYIRNFKHSRIGDSYRMEMVHKWKDNRHGGQRVVNSFDSDTGVNRGMVNNVNNPKTVEGRINTEQDIVDQTNRYIYWLDGRDNEIGQYLIRYLADHVDDLAISSASGNQLISIVHPWANASESVPLGRRTVIIDPAKGFLPVKLQGTKIDAETKKEVWFEALDVLESQLLKDLWMPTRFREVCSNKLRDPAHKAAVIDVNIRSIELDCVKPEDLSFTFPNRASVVDNIKGIAYTAGEDGLPSGKVQNK